MARILRTTGASFAFLLTTSLVGYFTRYLGITKFWWAFGIASAILVVGIVLCFFKNTKVNVLAFLINAVSMGFFLRSWYINRGFDNSLLLMLGVCLLAVAYLLLFVALLKIPFINNHYGWYLLIFSVLSVVAYVLLLVFTKTTWVSTLGYYGILQLSFILGLSATCNNLKEEVNCWCLSSCSVLVCAVVILLIVLGGDGDGLDAMGDIFSGIGDFSSPLNSPQNNQKPANNESLYLR